MPEEKRLLKQLQSSDTKLHELQTQHDAIPKKIKALETEIETLRHGIEELKASRITAQKELKTAELNLGTQEEAVGKYNSQLFSARTNEEYKVFLKEIETAEKNKKAFEDKIIEWMETIERIDKEIVAKEAELKREETAKHSEIESEKAKGAGLEQEIKEEKEKRENFRKAVPTNILAIYDRIQKNKGVLAAALILEGNRCSGCFNLVPDQKAIEAEHSSELSFCEYCGRILIK